jgi:electron transfer flavoprotein beta subunit
VKIVVLVKHVPDATADRRFGSDLTTDRADVDGLLSELDEYAVEEALRLAEAHDGEVVAMTMGPATAGDAIRRALQMGVGSGVHVQDDALHGSDALATSLVLARAVERVADVDLVLTGMASTDGGMGVVPAMLAERLGLPYVGLVGELEMRGRTIEGRRDDDSAVETVEAALPAVVSVTDQINDPRYPSFKGIMAAKKKPVQVWSLADLGIGAGEVGLCAARTTVTQVTERPPKPAGRVVTDEGDGGLQIGAFLAERSFV